MLKVVGASWLQTRIATYILIAVALLGIGAIVIGEFGRVENDGTYSATVTWNSKEGYRINFWGQGNDLETLPMSAARAYYKPRIHDIGWSIVEVETSSDYPDEVQAYSAGLLEGSLTWQIIHHHWYNTIATSCNNAESICEKIREDLKAHLAVAKKRAIDLKLKDPFAHMIRLFHAQLDGLEAGWKFAVRRSRKSADISSADFLWLAIASDLPNLLSSYNENRSPGGVLLKHLHDEMSEPLIALIHNTIAPYAKMLRLLKKYTFGYHMTGLKNATRVPTRSIIMSSYPGALSSQDEYYILNGEKAADIMVIAGIPFKQKIMLTSHHSAENSDYVNTNDKPIDDNGLEFNLAITSAKIMAANWLSSDIHSWSRLLGTRDERGNTFRLLQWVIVHAAAMSIWLVEQHPMVTYVVEYTNIFNEKGILFCDGYPVIVTEENDQQISTLKLPSKAGLQIRERESKAAQKARKFEEYVENIRTQIYIGNKNHEASTQNNTHVRNLSSKLLDEAPEVKQTMMFRGDLETIPKAFGAIDSKLSLVNIGGMFRFEATSGPLRHEDDIIPFEWSKAFPLIPHIGHPDKFNFETIIPKWVWF